MKDTTSGLLWTSIICSAIIAAAFGLLGGLLELEFALTIAYLAGIVMAFSIYGLVLIWILHFDWKEYRFGKVTFAGIVLAILNLIIYEVFNFELFHTIFIGCSVVATIAAVIGIIRTLFKDC